MRQLTEYARAIAFAIALTLAFAFVLASPMAAQTTKKGSAQKSASVKKSPKESEGSKSDHSRHPSIAHSAGRTKTDSVAAAKATVVSPTASTGSLSNDPPPAIRAKDPTPYAVTRPTPIAPAPNTPARGQLNPGTPVEILARDRGWVRIRTEGWVREADLTAVDTAIRTSVGAADLRSAPDRFRGVMLKWTVQYLATQTADTLRRGLSPGEPYMLARGPGQEDALVYLAIPTPLVGTARALTPLSKIVVVAKVRSGRSEPAGVPVLDVQSLQPAK